MSSENISITYLLDFGDALRKSFSVTLDGATLNLLSERRAQYPPWTLLEKFRCPNCPLDPERVERCPVVVNLFDIIEFFRDCISHQRVDVEVRTRERSYCKTTSVQDVLQSLVGIYMVSSGCPHFARLKPLLRFHLPFATVQETAFRMLSMYLMAQFFIERSGGEADWEMVGLAQAYEDIRIVNRNFCRRLSALEIQDATMNALVALDCFAFTISTFIRRDALEEVEALFRMFPEAGK